MRGYILSNHNIAILNNGQKYQIVTQFESINHLHFKQQSILEKEQMQLVIQLQNEITTHWKVNQCGNALKLFRVYESQDKIYLLLEYQEGGTLLNMIGKDKKLNEQDLQTIMEQLFLAVDFLHQRNIVHRDLKLENILLNSKDEKVTDIRIADFGLACELLPGIKLFHKCGTPSYIAPEVLMDNGYTTKVDIFSLGSIMYNLVTGKFLFNSPNYREILLLSKNCNLSHVEELTKSISNQARDLLMKILQPNPDKRLTARQALEHPWFSADYQILQQALQINAWLCSDNLKRNSAITSQIFLEQQLLVEPPDDEVEDIKDKSKSGNKSKDTLSSFLKGESFYQLKSSISQNSVGNFLNKSSDSVPINYYEMIQSHRRSTSQKPQANQTLKHDKSKFLNKKGSHEESKSSQYLQINKSKFYRGKSKELSYYQQISDLDLNLSNVNNIKEKQKEIIDGIDESTPQIKHLMSLNIDTFEIDENINKKEEDGLALLTSQINAYKFQRINILGGKNCPTKQRILIDK
ncbi:serine threonine protein kinase [Stylonychia lemnae]|uniref:Serine threonine protein kinase n=1 Tax=Stylonychia lemnae TaxID=5949 RepID=A0A078ADE1_STYLE|nr:serine threonine protein kinase [Stylonychia lemnae]|eukprot:CDW79552.1 serine threonine protein kinase [Stylonychia lemnae]